LTPNAVIGGATVAGKVTLDCNAAPGSVTVTLSSYDPSVATPVPSTLIIPKGQSSGTFNVTTKHVTTREKISITASANGTGKSPTLIVNP
jgi:hypothetical protein